MRTGLVVGLGVFCLVALASHLNWLRVMDNALSDLSFALRGPVESEHRVVVVSINDTSLSSLGPWPWPAQLWAEVLDRILDSGARVVALDLPSVSRAIAMPTGDGRALGRLTRTFHGRPVVLPFSLAEGLGTDTRALELLAPFICQPSRLPQAHLGEVHLEVPPEALATHAAGLGCISVYPDRDGVVRAAPLLVGYHGRTLPSLALEVVRLAIGEPAGRARYLGGRVHINQHEFAVLPSGEMLINYTGGYLSYKQIPVLDIMRGTRKNLSEQLRNRVVLVGPTFRAAVNTLATPVAVRMPGVEVQANVIGNLLRQDYLRPVSPAAAWPFMLALCLLGGVLVCGRSPVAGLAITLILVVAAWAAGHVLFCRGLSVPLGPPLTGLLLTGGSLVAAQAIVAERRRLEVETRLHSRLQTITGVAKLLDTGLDRQHLLDEIMRWVQAELDVEACSMLLLDESRQHLDFTVALGPKGHLAKAFEVQLGEGIAGLVAKTGEPLLVNDAANDPRRHRVIAEAIGYAVQKVACVPMTLHGETVGVIEAMNKRDGSDFTSHDASLLTAIAQQAALFLENLRLYSVLQERVNYANAGLVEAMRRLRSEKARIDTLVEGMADGVVATDEEGRIVLVNSRARWMLDLQGRALEGQPASEVIRHQRITELLTEAVPLDQGPPGEEVDLRGDGTVVVRVSAARIDGPDGERVGTCAVLTDITQLKQLDQMKTDLISFVSHQLKTPLTSLGMYGQLLRSRLGDANLAEASETANAIERQVRRMRYMVEDFLNEARIEAGRPLEMQTQPVDDVESLLDGIIQLEGKLAHAHRFIVQIPADLPVIWADRSKLEEVFINLVSNAIKYSPDGGDVTITARETSGSVCFTVSDEGIGISEEDQPHLFSRFQRLGAGGQSARVTGTGIGLFVCRALVEAHGGRIWVESQPGRGSAFHFTIPVYQAQDQQGASDAD